MRGTPGVAALFVPTVGITPAYAGNTYFLPMIPLF